MVLLQHKHVQHPSTVCMLTVSFSWLMFIVIINVANGGTVSCYAEKVSMWSDFYTDPLAAVYQLTVILNMGDRDL